MIPTKKIFAAAVVSACMLAVISGCKKSTPNNEPASTAAPAAASAPAPTAPVTLALTQPPQLAKDVDAIPRLAVATTPALVRVNATIAAIDKDARDSRREDKTFTRSVWVTMAGPGYLSVLITDVWVTPLHPDSQMHVAVFDLSTGKAVDWTKLVRGADANAPPDGGPIDTMGEPNSITYPALLKMYIEDPQYQENSDYCKDVFDAGQPFTIYPDAKSGKLHVSAFNLPHVVQVCGYDMMLTADQAKKLGFDQGLLDALATAHQQPGASKLGQ